VKRTIRTALAILALIAFGTTAAFAHPNHTHDDDDKDYADPVLFDNDIVNDCSLIGPDMILWELTGSDGVTSAELHTNAPEASVTTRSFAPYLFVTPRYDFAVLEADVDRILGDIADDAQLIATICDPNATDAPWLPYATGLFGISLGLIGGRRLAGPRTRS
jgi:hypothetical protein